LARSFEFNRAALIRPEGKRMSQLLISLIGAIEHENRSEAENALRAKLRRPRDRVHRVL
jgi:hypothetical protein